MNKKLQRTLIIFFATLFLISVPFAIFRSQGYGIDLKNRKIVKTGGLSLKTYPKQCKIYLNEELTKKTSLLFGDAFIKDLLPDEYEIKIEKSGYIPWEKTLKVDAGLVTKIENIILFPEELNLSTISSGIEDYFFSPDQKKIIFRKMQEDEWLLEYLNTETNDQTIILENSSLNKTSEFLELEWSYDSKNIILKTKDKDKKEITFSVVTNSETDKTQIIPLEFLSEVTEANFNPYNSKEIFFVENNRLSKINFLEQKKPEIILENFKAYKIVDGNILWLSQSGFIYKSDFSGKRLEIINSMPFSIESNKKYKIEAFDQSIFIKEDDSLYQFNEELKSFIKITDYAKELKISPDFQKLCILSNNEIHVLFLSDTLEQLKREKGQKIFLTRFSEEVKNLSWIDNYYLISNTGDKIKVVETDNRDGINIVTLGEFENSKLFWNSDSKKIYILSKKKLYSSEKIF